MLSGWKWPVIQSDAHVLEALGAQLAPTFGSPAGRLDEGGASRFADHQKLRLLDDNGQHQAAVAAALGTGGGDAGAAFARLSADLSSAINSDQAVFNSTARSAASAYSGLAAVTVAAALLMAAAGAWGLSRRISEYR